jgi:DNA-binding MarR family transcriptional regulator
VNENNQKIVILLKIISEQINREMTPVLSEYDLTASQYGIIKYFYKRDPQATRITDIKRKFSMSHPTVIGLIGQLEKKGYLERIRDPEDGRSKLLMLTEKAKRSQRELEMIGDRLEADFTRALSDDEKDALKQLLLKLLNEESYNNLTSD